MAKTLVRIDRNGTKYWEDDTCPRCGGSGGSEAWAYTGWTCYKCNGTGRVKPYHWKEYTEEYAAKLWARRLAKQAKWEAEHAEELEAERRAKEEAERKRKEEEERKAREEAERKAISQFVGTVGEKLTITAVYQGSPWYERQAYGGFGKETVYIHRFIAEGNLIVWKTGTYPKFLHTLEEGETVTITGVVKSHSEYKDEKQTQLIRVKEVNG